MTIRLNGLWKTYRVAGIETVVAAGIDAEFPSGRAVALLGRNGAGKSSLLRMIAGSMAPDAGTVEREGSVSWPVGFAGSFHGDLTGAENARFVARLYGVETAALLDFVAEFAELGPRLHAPFRTYSSGMRARLAFAVSMAVPFDTYLVDEVTSVGDARFRAKSEAMLAERMGTSGAIIVSHALPLVERLCDLGAVLNEGRITLHDSVGEAIAHHRALMA